MSRRLRLFFTSLREAFLRPMESTKKKKPQNIPRKSNPSDMDFLQKIKASLTVEHSKLLILK